jgi:hypothetical protein
MGELTHFLLTQTRPLGNGMATIVAAEFSKEAISSIWGITSTAVTRHRFISLY